jgi:WD40 repeat protein
MVGKHPSENRVDVHEVPMRRFLPIAILLFTTLVGCQKNAAPNAPIEQPIQRDIVQERPIAPIEKEDDEDRPAVQQPRVAAFSLDHLDRKDLSPLDRSNWPDDVVAVIRHDAAATVMSLAFSSDGKRLVMARANGNVEIWDLSGAKPAKQGNLQVDNGVGQASRVAFSRDGNWMASIHGFPGKTVILWKLSDDGDIRAAFTVEFPRTDSLAFHPHSKWLVAATGNNGAALAVSDKGFERLPFIFPGVNSSLTFTSDGNSFASVVFNPARNGNLYGSEAKIWSVANNQIGETHLFQQDRMIKALAFSPDNKTLAIAALDLKVHLYDLTANPPALKATFATLSWLKGLDFTPDGNHLLAVGNSVDVSLWNVKDKREQKTWRFAQKKLGAGGGPFSASALAPDGRHVAISTFNSPVTFVLRLPIAK